MNLHLIKRCLKHSSNVECAENVRSSHVDLNANFVTSLVLKDDFSPGDKITFCFGYLVQISTPPEMEDSFIIAVSVYYCLQLSD